MNIQEIIEKNPNVFNMLKNCPYEILKQWELKEYPRNFIICKQGEIYNYFNIIIDGHMNIYMTAENGRRYSQSVYKKGDFFGELEIFSRKPYICFVETLTDSIVLRISRDYFLQWIELDSNIMNYFTRTLCDQFYKLSKKAGEDTLYSLKHRVCSYLLCCLNEGIEKNEGIILNIKKEQLSQQFAVTQRSINRILHYLDEVSIIEIKNSYIIIKNLEKLHQEEEISKYE